MTTAQYDDGSQPPGELPPSVPVDWFTDGLLWAINASLLHPLGYALSMDPVTGDAWLMGDGTERWAFDEADPATKAMVDQRFVEFHALLARATEATRAAEAST